MSGAADTVCRSCGASVTPRVSGMRMATALETCRVERWRGYVTSSFYAISDAGVVLAESPSFRWRRKQAPPDRGRIRAAWDALVAELAADGWEPTEASGSDWYRARFTRTW